MFLVVMFYSLFSVCWETLDEKIYRHEKWYSIEIQYIGKNNVIFV